jgi:regulator of nucleoside diphosphate kinase
MPPPGFDLDITPVRGTVMNERRIHITDQDMRRLRALLNTTSDPLGKDRSYLEALRAELDRAKIVASESIDGDVVTMNSKVRVRGRDTGLTTTLTVVFPESADAGVNRISVIAPLGAAVLGYRAGDRVSFRVPDGMREVDIEEVVYQPEAAGDMHL